MDIRMCSVLQLQCLFFWNKALLSFSCWVVTDSLWPPGLQPAKLLCPWDFPGKNTGVGCHFLLQGIFPTQGLNPRLLHWQKQGVQMGKCWEIRGRATDAGARGPRRWLWAWDLHSHPERSSCPEAWALCSLLVQPGFTEPARDVAGFCWTERWEEVVLGGRTGRSRGLEGDEVAPLRCWPSSDNCEHAPRPS